MTDRRRRRAVAAALIILAVVAVAEQAHAAYGVMRHHVTGDQAIMWVAGRDWGRLAFHQPTFYGQSYGTNFEGLPIEVLRRLGLPLATAAPLAYAALNVGCWLVLGVAAWRRRLYHLAALAFAAPTLLSSYLSLFNSYSGSVGRLMAAAGAAWLLTEPERRPARAGAWTLLVTGAVLDGSAFVFAAPVGVWVILRRLRPLPRAAPETGAATGAGTVLRGPAGLGAEAATVALALVPGLVWTAGLRWFYAVHPDYAMTGLSVRPHARILRESLDRPEQFFHMFAPELWRAWWLPVAALAVLVVVLVAGRRRERAVPALLVVVLVLLVMSTTRAALIRETFVLPHGRLLAGLPYALWFLLGLATGLDGPVDPPAPDGTARGAVPGGARPAARRDPSLSAPRLAVVAGIAVLALTTAGLRLADFDGRVAAVAGDGTATQRAPGLALSRYLAPDCRSDARLARSAGAGLVVYLHDHASAYGCAAMGSGVETLTPGRDRRTWRLTAEADRTRDAAVLVDVDPGFCSDARPHLTSCRAVARRDLIGGRETAAVVTFRPQPVTTLLPKLGVAVRGFGPGCHLVGGALHEVPECRPRPS